MKFQNRPEILLVKKDTTAALSQDIYVQEDDSDKRLIVADVIEWTDRFNKWEKIIVGKYSLYQLTYKWEDFFFVEEGDILSTINED